jgi:hypothetical protein
VILLKTAAQQAAGYLAQMRATEALLEARKFDAFNRMSAFVVHDLKNIVTQLSLMMKNAQRLHANPEFQQDMLLTVESSLEKMRRLMLQLREGATPPGNAHGVDMAAVLQRLDLMARGAGGSWRVSCEESLFTRGHEDRLERVLGHLVQNAFRRHARQMAVCGSQPGGKAGRCWWKWATREQEWTRTLCRTACSAPLAAPSTTAWASAATRATSTSASWVEPSMCRASLGLVP